MVKVLALSNHKGGVGKSCSVANIGAALNKSKKKVLLIDLDPQANLSLSFGIKDTEKGIYEVLMGKFSLRHARININKGL